MIVVDASALLEFLLQTSIGAPVEARLLRDNDELHAPHLVDVEVVQGLRRLVRMGEVSSARADEAIARISSTSILTVRYRHSTQIRRAVRNQWVMRARAVTACNRSDLPPRREEPNTRCPRSRGEYQSPSLLAMLHVCASAAAVDELVNAADIRLDVTGERGQQQQPHGLPGCRVEDSVVVRVDDLAIHVGLRLETNRSETPRPHHMRALSDVDIARAVEDFDPAASRRNGHRRGQSKYTSTAACGPVIVIGRSRGPMMSR